MCLFFFDAFFDHGFNDPARFYHVRIMRWLQAVGFAGGDQLLGADTQPLTVCVRRLAIVIDIDCKEVAPVDL